MLVVLYLAQDNDSMIHCNLPKFSPAKLLKLPFPKVLPCYRFALYKVLEGGALILCIVDLVAFICDIEFINSLCIEMIVN